VTERRQYGQFCGLASALDVIGERWTILIMRELLIGPARFSNLLDNLPGIGPNMLSERLRELGQHGLVVVEPVAGDARGKQYLLTPSGEELRAPLLGLARWGMRFLTNADAEAGASRAAWGFLAVQSMLDQSRLPDQDEDYQFEVDGEAFHIRVADGAASAGRGPVPSPALVITTDAETFIRVGARLVTAFEAVITGRIRAEGDPLAIQRCTRLLGLADPIAAAAGAG
jgi:DNA-binding HxlR family transcriptional regulator